MTNLKLISGIIFYSIILTGCNDSNNTASTDTFCEVDNDDNFFKNDTLKPSCKWSANISKAALKPPMGWNSWNAFRVDVDQEKVESSARLIKDKGLLDKGYQYINIDDGWWLKRLANGKIEIRSERFPITKINNDTTSFKPWTDKLHDLGFKAGIYSEIGRNTCGQYWDSESPVQPEGENDELNVGLYGRFDDDIKMYFNEWGFDYIKVDACGVADYTHERLNNKFDYLGNELVNKYTPFDPPLIVRDSLDKTNHTEIENIFNKIHKSLIKWNPDNDFLFSICTWGTGNVKEWGKNYGTSWRTSDDIHPTLSSMINNLDSVKARALYAQPGAWNDPDMLQIGNGEFGPSNKNFIPNSQFHMGMWAMLNSPLLIGTDLRQAPQEIIEILGNSKVISINQDQAGNQANLVWKDNKGRELYIKQLSKYGEKALALINRGKDTATVKISWKDLKMKPNLNVTFENLWTGEIFTKNSDFNIDITPNRIHLWKINGTPIIDNGYFLSSLPGRINIAEDGVGNNIKNPPSGSFQGNRSGWGGARIDHSPWDRKIEFVDGIRNYGIGILANSRIEFKNESEFSQLKTTVGIDINSVGNDNRVIFRIYGDGKLLTQSDPITKFDSPQELIVDIRNKNIIELIVVEKNMDAEEIATVAWGNTTVIK